MSRQGKIKQCPPEIREAINHRLRAGDLGPQILPWLNDQPDVKKVLAEFFHGDPVNVQNLSAWRRGEYAKWEECQDKTHRLKELAAFAVKYTEANGGKIAQGASAIASGKLLELMEAIDGNPQSAILNPQSEDTPSVMDQLGEVIAAIASLRAGEIAQQRANLDARKLDQKAEDQKLALARFQRDTCNLFIKWAADRRAIEAATGAGDNSSKIDQLGQIMFGEDWKPPAG
jgi:hypothetical protein